MAPLLLPAAQRTFTVVHAFALRRYADRHSPDGKITTLLDYTGFAMKNNPPMKTSMATLHMIQSYYPERLHEALLWHPPALFQAVWKALSPFVEVKTRHKIKFLMQRDPTSPAQLAERCASRSAGCTSAESRLMLHCACAGPGAP